MEEVTLADRVRRTGPLDGATATALAHDLLTALAAAHDAGVAHRDVKPATVLLSADGTAELTGLPLGDDEDLLIGAPAYLAPEQLDGAAPTSATDLWALGATLWFAVEGRPLFAGTGPAATLTAVLTADIPVPRVADPLGAVIVGLLHRAPGQRLTGPQAIALLDGTG